MAAMQSIFPELQMLRDRGHIQAFVWRTLQHCDELKEQEEDLFVLLVSSIHHAPIRGLNSTEVKHVK